MTGSSRPAGPPVWVARAVVMLATVTGSVVHAQAPVRAPGPESKHLLVVPAFASQDKALGCAAANAVRSRLEDDAEPKKLWIVPQRQIDDALKASGFPTCQPVSPTDDKMLTVQLRGDAYLDGVATRAPEGLRLETRIVLNRDQSAAQPLPPATGPKVGDAARQVSRDVIAAMKQVPGEDKCFNAARDGKYADALAAAHAAIAAYPQSTIARLCIVNVYVLMKQPTDSIISVAQQILAQDPHNRRALELSGQSYYEKKDYDNAVKAWGTLIASDPSNTVMVEDIVTKIVQSGHADAALPIVQQAIKDNPDDPKLTELLYRLYIVSKRYHDAIPLGPEAIKNDTAFADTLYFQRQTTAFLNDSQPQKAAEQAAEGLKKFPNSVTLQQIQVQALLRAGQTQQAIEVLKKALAANPKSPSSWEQLFTAYVNTQQPDSALWALHQAVANGDSASQVAPFALSQGNAWFKKGQINKNVDTLEIGARFLAYADSLKPSDPAKFLLGTTQYIVGATLDQEAVKSKNCDMVKEVKSQWTQALVNLHAGASVQPGPAAQFMEIVNKYLPVVDKQVKQFCK